jgi:hypothetical protein
MPAIQTSSMMEEPTYDADKKTAIVRFKKGGTYHYPMSLEEFLLFHDAESWGKFFHSHGELFKNGVKQGSPEPTS